MDKYDASNDHYCYKGTSTLKNKLNILDLEILEKAEREITGQTIKNINYSNPPYSLAYLQNLHKTLFVDLYTWSGEIRDVNISKGDTPFCFSENIENEIQKIFLQLEKDNWLKDLKKDIFCETLAEYYCEFNMIHPFREGNGRVQRIFFENLALSAGYFLSWNGINQNEWIQANIDGVYVIYEPMEIIFKRIVKEI